MMSVFLEPIDVLYLRGNPHFGTAGAHGAALMPPWPSLAAGALRSRLIAEGVSVENLAAFRLTHFGLAQRRGERAELLLPLPADVLVTSEDLSDARYARPTALPQPIATSHPLPKIPVFASDKPAKPVGGLWLTVEGIRAWLAGDPITAAHLCRAGDLWQSEVRLGIALDAQKRTAAESRIYTAEAVAFADGIGFAAGYQGAPELPGDCLVRLGGDGRGAVLRKLAFAFPEANWQRIEQERRFRLLLVTPGVFSDGWRPAGIPATLVAASIGRAETVSGWDLVSQKPKTAQRVVPSGSVYWFEDFSGDIASLKRLAESGLPSEDPQRAAEGFGKLVIAPWSV